MEVLLSRSTFATRWVFPVFWTVFALAVAIALMPDRMWERDPLYLVGPTLMLALIGWGYRAMTATLVDEVRDGGTELLVRKGDVEAPVALADIVHINANAMSYPDRVTVWLRSPGPFGERFDFLTRKSRWPLDPRPSLDTFESLVRRLDGASRGVQR